MINLLFWQHPLIGHDIYGDDLTAKALESCKKTVLHPYLGFLKVVSWFGLSWVVVFPRVHYTEVFMYVYMCMHTWPCLTCMD